MKSKRKITCLLLIFVLLLTASCKKELKEEGAMAGTVVPNKTPPIAQEEYDYDELDLKENSSQQENSANQEKPSQKEQIDQEDIQKNEAEESKEENQQNEAEESKEENQFKTEFDTATGTLTISGKGEIRDYYPKYSGKEEQYAERTVKKIVFGEGITGIYNSFNQFFALNVIEFSKTIKIIDGSFNDAISLTALTVPATIKKIVNFSFNNCPALKDLKFEGPIEIGSPSAFITNAVEILIIPAGSKLYGCFNYCDQLKEVMIGANTIIGEGNLGEDQMPNFSSVFAKDRPKFYFCMPIAEVTKKEYGNMRCGEGMNYRPLHIPEGESWEDYRDVPMELWTKE